MIKERFEGKEDPLAEKIMKKLDRKVPDPPTDLSITTLFIGGVTEELKEAITERFN